jgi:hypothetical protein
MCKQGERVGFEVILSHRSHAERTSSVMTRGRRQVVDFAERHFQFQLRQIKSFRGDIIPKLKELNLQPPFIEFEHKLSED